MKHDHPPVVAHNWRATVDGASPSHWLRLSATTTANADPALRRPGRSERFGNRRRRCPLWDHQRRRRHWPSVLADPARGSRRALGLHLGSTISRAPTAPFPPAFWRLAGEGCFTASRTSAEAATANPRVVAWCTR